jgi:hypothetical protein
MTLPKLNLRDLFWIVVVVAMGVGWWLDRTSTYWYAKRAEKIAVQAGMQAQAAEASLWQERERHKKLLAEIQQRGIEISVD